MKYCKHLKKRKNKPYCNLLKQEIPFCRCWECGNKEYKTKNVKNSSYKYEISTVFVKNSENSDFKFENCTKIAKMKNKSRKLAKLERKRKSVFTDDLEHCYLCGNKKDNLH